MDGATLQFLLFGLAAALFSNLNRSSAWRSTVLLVFSLLFIVLLTPRPITLAPFFGFVLMGYSFLFALQRGWSRWLGAAVTVVIVAFAWLKKYTFLPEGSFITAPYFTLGLSYVFFRVLHLLIESETVGRPQLVGVRDYLTYLLNFTTFVSGPIQRYDEFWLDLHAESAVDLDIQTVATQFERIVRGFFKVNVLALLFHILQMDALATLSQPVNQLTRMRAALELAAIYPLFLYCNFSGYIDIVIAIARIMGLRLPENFDRPFSSSSFLDFWNRWHITLSTWLKTYVYNPLLIAMMRRTSTVPLQRALGVFSFFVTFFLVGIWHGRSSEFAFFGVLQGGGVAVNKIWQIWLTEVLGKAKYRSICGNRIYQSVGRGLTFTWFAFTLFWFWATWHQLATVSKALSVTSWIGISLFLWFASTVILAAWEWFRNAALSSRFENARLAAGPYGRMVCTTFMGVISFTVTVLLDQPAPDIVYKTF